MSSEVTRDALRNVVTTRNIWNPPPPSHQVAFYALCAARPLRLVLLCSSANLATVKHPTPGGGTSREGFPPPFSWMWTSSYQFARPRPLHSRPDRYLLSYNARFPRTLLEVPFGGQTAPVRLLLRDRFRHYQHGYKVPQSFWG